MKIRKVAVKAHNQKLPFPSFNQAWNEAEGLGTMEERSQLKYIALKTYGIFGDDEMLTPLIITEHGHEIV